MIVFAVLIFLFFIATIAAAFIFYLCDEYIWSKKMMADINKKAVLITGCGSGFGKALVIRCLRNGMTVFAGCRRTISVEELESQCKGLSGKLFAFQMDVTCDKSVTMAKQFVSTKLIELQQELFALVNNAGIRGTHLYDDLLTMDDYKSVWETNTFGTIRVTQAFKQLLKQSRGRVIICGSGCILFVAPSYGPYATSKAAIACYADVIRHELNAYGVDVIHIMPGSFDSGMQDTDRLSSALQTRWDCCDEKIRQEYGEQYIRRAKKFLKIFQERGVSKDVQWVEDTYFHAIASKYPKPVYRVGWDTILFFHPYSLLPLKLQQIIMKLLFWLFKPPVADAVSSSSCSARG